MSFRSPLARARGLGAAHSGTHHWWIQRLTSVALMPLLLWFAVSFASLATADYATATAWLRHPLNAVLMLALLGNIFHHMLVGMQVVIEDYIHGRGAKIAVLIVVKFSIALLAIGAIFAVLKVAFS
ncbi:MAG: succinate dehydrogenase, hydrophobic membrane anchor protein [Alphaproteobacteria bacterium]|jgi:succinate dehydrogenase / fumarate reductase membrane anchor subunit|nr:succinate dehydrogenase, hydrophobic membrane anchor protein [Alphaproteobacteria bacterium]